MLQTGELLAKVRKIEIKTRKMVDELTGGAYHSVFKGRGIEFSEVREYTPDDDVRDIDWNVTARMGTPYVKKYSEERELTVILAVDISASGTFGSGETDKREQMAECAALLAFSAIRNNDKVGLLLFTDRTELYLPPRSGRKHVLRVIRELIGTEPGGRGTDVGGALETLAGTLKKRAVIFLISDFIDDKDYEKSLKIISRKHDVIALRVQDPVERAIPAMTDLELEDAESSENFSFSASGTMADAYRDAADKFSGIFKENCRHAKVDLIDICCGEDIVKSLLNFFHARTRKIH